MQNDGIPGDGQHHPQSLKTTAPFRLQCITILILFAVVFAVFSASLHFDFVQWDDDINVYENPHVQRLDSENLAWMFTDLQHALRYKPLSWLSWAAIHSVFGPKAHGFHAANLLLHMLNTALVFLVMQKVLRLVAREFTAKALIVSSAAGALLWAIHPLRTEPVVWVTGLPYCQSIFFLLISLLLYLEAGRRTPGERHRAVLYWGSVAVFTLSLLTYPIVLGFVGLLLAIDCLLLRNINPAVTLKLSRRAWLEKIPFVVLSLLLVTLALVGRAHAAGEWVAPENLEKFGAGSRLMQAAYVWAYYVWKPWLPLDLSPVYTTLLSFRPLQWFFVLSLALIVALSAVVFWRYRQWPLACAHLALLVPVLGLTEHPHYASDRYGYLAGILWPIFIASLLIKFWPQQNVRYFSLLVVAALAGIFAVASFRQAQVWRNSETLFRHVIAKLGDTPVSGPIHVRLSRALSAQGRHEEAWTEMMTAVKIAPNNPDTQAGAGSLLAARGQAADAVKHYREALKMKPDWAETQNNLAWLLATHPNDQLRNGTEAVQLAERACELTGRTQPQFIGTLAAAYAETGRFDAAIAAGEQARALAFAAGNSELAAANERLIESYRAGKPIRQP